MGAAFTAGWAPSGGIEATLWQFLHLLLAHDLIIVGLPWTAAMRSSGSYYGATACGRVTDADREQARALGYRVARVMGMLVAGRETLSKPRSRSETPSLPHSPHSEPFAPCHSERSEESTRAQGKLREESAIAQDKLRQEPQYGETLRFAQGDNARDKRGRRVALSLS